MALFSFIKKVAIGAAIGLTGGLAAAPFLIGSLGLIGGLVAANVLAAGIGFLATRSPKIGAVEELTDRITLTQNANEPKWIGYGQFGMSGNVGYQEQISNELWVVITLPGHEIDSMVSFRWGDTTVTFSSNNAVGDLNGFLYKYDFLGTDAQTVWAALDSASSNWTSAHRGRGQSYIGIKWVQDQESAPDWQNPVQVLKGRKLYDPRKDSTNGGSGSHRLTDQSTWEWSDNSALCIVDYEKGIRVANSLTTSYDGQLIAGMGIADARIDWARVIADADACDESIDLDAGGSESRYTCNGLIDPRNDHRTNLEILASSMGGKVVFQGGKWRVYSAVARAAVKTRSADDIIGNIKVRRYKSREDGGKANAVRGVYADVNANFKPRDIIPLVNSTYVTEDGGDELWMDVNLPMTTSGTMAQRLAKIALERNRREIVVTANFLPVALQDQAMDSITFNHPALGLSSQKMRVADWQMGVAPDDEGNPMVVFPMVLEEEDDAIYVWDETTDEQAIPASVTVSGVARNSAITPSGDIASGIGMDQGDGIVRQIPFGSIYISGRDTDAKTFDDAYNSAPHVAYIRGGGTFDGGGLSNTAIHQNAIEALSVTATGFTIQAELKETASSLTGHTDGDGTGTETAWNSGNGPTNPDWQAGKEATAAAWNSTYIWKYTVSVDGLPEPGDITPGFYTNINGAGWVKRAQRTHFSSTTNATKSIVVTGLSTTGPDGDLYGVDIESSSGATLDDVVDTQYDTATAPTTVTATPTGAEDVVFRVEGGVE